MSLTIIENYLDYSKFSDSEVQGFERFSAPPRESWTSIVCYMKISEFAKSLNAAANIPISVINFNCTIDALTVAESPQVIELLVKFSHFYRLQTYCTPLTSSCVAPNESEDLPNHILVTKFKNPLINIAWGCQTDDPKDTCSVFPDIYVKESKQVQSSSEDRSRTQSSWQLAQDRARIQAVRKPIAR